MAPKRPWSAEFTASFIELYRSLPSLWKVKSADYGNKLKKAEAYKTLVNLVKTEDEKADEDFVKAKINTLRSSFRKELQKIRNSKRPNSKEPVHVPKLWYFEMLTFLTEQETHHTNNEEQLEIGNYCEEAEIECQDQPTVDETSNTEHDSSTEAQATITRRSLHCRNGVMKRKYSDNDQYSEAMVQETRERLNAKKSCRAAITDETDAFGTIVSAKLRSMNKVQRLFAEKLITDALFKGIFEQLSPRTEIIDRQECYDPGNNVGNSPNAVNYVSNQSAENESQLALAPKIENFTLPLS